jgi:diaminopimelate decarboxylase
MLGPFRLSPDQARDFAARFETPLYVLSEAHFLDRIAEFRGAAPGARLSYATKSNGTMALVQLAHRAGMHIDVASEGELKLALKAGVPAGGCTMHGNNKSAAEVVFALEQGIGEIVIDCLEEMDLIAASRKPGIGAALYSLRINPGLDSDLNPKVNTAARFSKFGFPAWDGQADQALERAQGLGLQVSGLHCHLGSQIMDPQVHGRAAPTLVSIMERHPEFEWRLLNLGGGFGIRYTDENPPSFADFFAGVRPHLPPGVRLAFEPGRSVVGPAGLTLYSVGPIKTLDGKRAIAVDGGLADNPRPALYGAKYTVESFRNGEATKATIVGRHCENDVLHEDVMLPNALEKGDLLQVLSTGAYSSSMASNYNRYPRPATVLLRQGGEAVQVQKREGFDEMLAREIGIDGL